MPARADGAPATTVLLTIDGGNTVWAIPSAAVTNIEPFTDADAETAADVRALLGAAPAPDQTKRVLTLQDQGQRLRLLTCGALRLRTVAEHELVPLPPAFDRCSPLVTHVALVDGRAELLVLSAERLLLALKSAASFSSTTLSHRPEALPC